MAEGVGDRLASVRARAHLALGELPEPVLRQAWLAAHAGGRALRGRRAEARRALALLAGRPAGPAVPPPAETGLLLGTAVEAAFLSGARALVVGGQADWLADQMAGLLSVTATISNGPPAIEAIEATDLVVSAGLLEAGPPDAVPQLLARLVPPRGALLACLPLWPAGRHAALRDPAVRTLRGRVWWDAAIAAAGLEEALDVREAGGYGCLLLAPRRGGTPLAAAGASRAPGSRRPGSPPAPAPGAPHVRLNDDLSRGTSFSWITASLVDALQGLGVRVSIAPTTIAPSFEPERRAALERLVERAGPPSRVDAEVGWTHFWPEYRRALGGRSPLALFAINYSFARADPDEWDPWIRRLLAEPTPIGAISTFCRDVLVHAGVERRRLRVVPMGVTPGIEGARPARFPDARDLKLLHVTNARDSERHGTALALRAHAAAYDPRDPVTLVVRDYGGHSPSLRAAVDRLVAAGYDVRYWPVFLSAQRLGPFIGAFDAQVAPFRGEGFGIKLLDAMACGVPLVCPFHGGPRDFVDGEVAFELPFDLVAVEAGTDSRELRLGNGPLWAQCRVEPMTHVLRRLLEDRHEVARRGANARERALGAFTWRHSALRLLEAVGL